jgi:hypothetical protein
MGGHWHWGRAGAERAEELIDGCLSVPVCRAGERTGGASSFPSYTDDSAHLLLDPFNFGLTKSHTNSSHHSFIVLWLVDYPRVIEYDSVHLFAFFLLSIETRSIRVTGSEDERQYLNEKSPTARQDDRFRDCFLLTT